MAKAAVKSVIHAAATLCVLPSAILAGFGRISVLFTFFSQCWALVPGLPGDYLRVAWYCLTLENCSAQSRISFGSFFAQRDVTVEPAVYIGAYCIIGSSRIGRGTQIASHVQILNGSQQHARDEAGRMLSYESGTHTVVSIGADCWIGAGAVVMADVGPQSTIGAGAVVTKPVPPGVVAVGIPARPLKVNAASN